MSVNSDDDVDASAMVRAIYFQPMVKRRLLIVSDNSALSHSIQNEMENATTEIHCAASVSSAVSRIASDEYCLIITDLQLQGIDKREMIRILRTVKHIPIIAISDHLEADELIDLYHSGADAYMEKPIDSRICTAQANALINLYFRADEESQKRATLAFGTALVISPRYRQVLINGSQINLTRKQFDLLLYLAQHCHQVFSTKQLYEQIWNDLFGLGGENTVTVHINTLRKKMGSLGPKVIQTVRGFGYQFIPPPDPAS